LVKSIRSIKSEYIYLFKWRRKRNKW